MASHAGIVDEDVDIALACGEPGEARRHRLRIADVCHRCDDGNVGCGKLRGEIMHGIAAIEDDQPAPERPKSQLSACPMPPAAPVMATTFPANVTRGSP